MIRAGIWILIQVHSIERFRLTGHQEERTTLVPPGFGAGIGQVWEGAEVRQTLPVFGGELWVYVRNYEYTPKWSWTHRMAERDEEPSHGGGLEGVGHDELS